MQMMIMLLHYEKIYWGENGVMCTFRVEIEESDVDVIAFISEE